MNRRAERKPAGDLPTGLDGNNHLPSYRLGSLVSGEGMNVRCWSRLLLVSIKKTSLTSRMWWQQDGATLVKLLEQLSWASHLKKATKCLTKCPSPTRQPDRMFSTANFPTIIPHCGGKLLATLIHSEEMGPNLRTGRTTAHSW